MCGELVGVNAYVRRCGVCGCSWVWVCGIGWVEVGGCERVGM